LTMFPLHFSHMGMFGSDYFPLSNNNMQQLN
jgi:hypothetical protein